jgi:hypothetical protein
LPPSDALDGFLVEPYCLYPLQELLMQHPVVTYDVYLAGDSVQEAGGTQGHPEAGPLSETKHDDFISAVLNGGLAVTPNRGRDFAPGEG